MDRRDPRGARTSRRRATSPPPGARPPADPPAGPGRRTAPRAPGSDGRAATPRSEDFAERPDVQSADEPESEHERRHHAARPDPKPRRR
jgi:hypothetical protein